MDAQKLLAAIQDLAPLITARAAEIEAARELPRDLLRDLVAAGCFRMFVPRSHGGLEIDLPSGLEVFEAFARADGSTGWSVMIGAEAVMLLALLPRHRFDALYADGPDLIGAGSFTPRGEAKVIDGGFEVTAPPHNSTAYRSYRSPPARSPVLRSGGGKCEVRRHWRCATKLYDHTASAFRSSA